MLVRKCDICDHIIGDEEGYMIDIFKNNEYSNVDRDLFNIDKEEIKNIDILNITPIEAMNILYKLKEKIKYAFQTATWYCRNGTAYLCIQISMS